MNGITVVIVALEKGFISTPCLDCYPIVLETQIIDCIRSVLLQGHVPVSCVVDNARFVRNYEKCNFH